MWQPPLTGWTLFLWAIILNTFICLKDPYFQNLGVLSGDFCRAWRHLPWPRLHRAAPTLAPNTSGRANASANYTWQRQRRRWLHLAAPMPALTTPGSANTSANYTWPRKRRRWLHQAAPVRSQLAWLLLYWWRFPGAPHRLTRILLNSSNRSVRVLPGTVWS